MKHLKLLMHVFFIFIISTSYSRSSEVISGEYSNKSESIKLNTKDKSVIIKTKSFLGTNVTIIGTYIIDEETIYVLDKTGKTYGSFTINGDNLIADKDSHIKSLSNTKNAISKRSEKIKVLYESIKNKLTYTGVIRGKMPAEFKLIPSDDLCVFILKTKYNNNRNIDKETVNIKNLDPLSIYTYKASENMFAISVNANNNKNVIKFEITKNNKVETFVSNNTEFYVKNSTIAKKVAKELALAINICNK